MGDYVQTHKFHVCVSLHTLRGEAAGLSIMAVKRRGSPPPLRFALDCAEGASPTAATPKRRGSSRAYQESRAPAGNARASRNIIASADT